MKKLILIAAPLCLASSAFAQVSYTGGTYTQDFDTLANTGTANTWTNNTTLTGWYSDRIVYIGSTGSLNNGGLHSFGAASSSERALGSLGSSSAAPDYALYLVNNTGDSLSSFTVSFTGEQWRNGGNTSQQLVTFSYRLGGTSLYDGAYTNESSLDMLTPVTGSTAAALDGNLAANQLNLSHTFNISVADGQSIWLRWTDINDPGNDHGLGIDDLSFTAEAVPEPATMTILAGAAALAGLRRRKK